MIQSSGFTMGKLPMPNLVCVFIFCSHPFATLAISCISGFARLCENRSIEHLDNRIVFQRFHDKSVSWVKALRYERYAMTVSVLASRPDAACCKGSSSLG